MKGILKWLNQPYPFAGDLKSHLLTALGAGLFVMLFLFIFRPFGIQFDEGYLWHFAGLCVGFGLITTLIVVLEFFIFRLIPNFYQEEGWVIWKEIFINIILVMLIAVANMVYYSFLVGLSMSLGMLWFWIKMTIGVGIFPIIFTAWSKQQILQKRHAKGAVNLNSKLLSHHEATSNEIPPLTLQGDNQNERLSITASDLFFLKASDNYVEVCFSKNGSLEQELLRSTLKKMEQQLNGSPQFYRCHRTYLVNLNKVEKVSGNAQGYKLHLTDCATRVPVSRSLNNEIDKKLSSSF